MAVSRKIEREIERLKYLEKIADFLSKNCDEEVLRVKSNEIALKHAGYLKQFKDRKSSKTTAGRKRKWIIIKKPYVE